MNILIFGAGSVGQAVGCLLSSDGHTVDMIVRDRYLDALRTNGLTVSGIFGDFRAEPSRTGYYTTIDAVIDRAYEYVLITTKSYDTVTALDEIMKLRNKQFIAVSMQNGCGNVEQLVERLGVERTLGARVITGFEIESPGRVVITVSADAVHIGGWIDGEIPDSASRLASALNHAGLPAESTPHIKSDLFAKLLYNRALNPLSAILGVHYGALADEPNTHAIME
jgi:2-dehydropantoate 2-reductase